jgi:hypothetical protein
MVVMLCAKWCLLGVGEHHVAGILVNSFHPVLSADETVLIQLLVL